MTDLEDRIRSTHFIAETLRYINDTPELLSLLYDLDLMPEQIQDRGSWQWRQMLILAGWHQSLRTTTDPAKT